GVQRRAVGGARGGDGAAAEEGAELIAQAVDGAALAADEIRGADELAGIEAEAEIAGGGVPGVIAALDVERAIEALLDAGAEAGDGFVAGQPADGRAQGVYTRGDLVPVGEFKKRDRSDRQDRESAESERSLRGGRARAGAGAAVAERDIAAAFV